MTNDNQWYAVPEGTRYAGLETFWRLSGTVDYRALADAWAAAGLDPALLPPAPSPRKALRRALRGEAHKRRLLRPLAGAAGYALVDERASEETVDHHVRATARLNAVGRPEVAPGNGEDVGRLQASVDARYDAALGALSSNDVSDWLCRLVGRLRAVALRDTGGIYYVPQEHVDTWLRWRAVLVGVSAHHVERIPMLGTSEVLEAVLHGLEDDAAATAADLEHHLEQARAGEIGKRAVGTQIARCEEAEAKIAMYEQILGRHLTDMTSKLADLRGALVVAQLSGDGADELLAPLEAAL